MPRVTVIIATYNWSTVLPHSIGSVLAQSFTDFELLVIGDGCTDDSEAVVTAIQDPRVRWINIERAGHQFGPNNEGLRQARGEFIAYLGHDDLWFPHHLQSHVAALETGADITHSIVESVHDDGSVDAIITGAPGEWRPPSSVVHRRDPIVAIGGWRHPLAIRVPSEQDLWMRAAAAGLRFQFVPRLTVVKFPALERRNVYRQRPSHEQAQWFARMRSEEGMEAIELARIAMKLHAWSRPRRLASRAWQLLRRPSQWLAFFFRGSGARTRAGQRYKGVDRVVR